MDYETAIVRMAGALEPAEESVGSEYRRGVVGTLAELYAISGQTIDERMEDVDADLTRQLEGSATTPRKVWEGNATYPGGAYEVLTGEAARWDKTNEELEAEAGAYDVI